MTYILIDPTWLKPRKPINPEKWVEENMYFSGRQGSVAGYWSHARFPYSRGVLQTFNDPSIQEIVLDWGTQLGKTALLGGFVCWAAANDPASMMVTCPNQSSAHEHYKTKLEPYLESCTEVAKLLPIKSKRSMELVDLKYSWVYYAYSGSRTSLSQRSVKYLCITEINLFSHDDTREGDPVGMARDRTKAFRNKKIFIEGKPTIKGICRITKEYEESDMRKFYLPCPFCKKYQVLVEGTKLSDYGLKWERDKDNSSSPKLARRTAYYQCQHCHKRIDEKYKLLMLRKGLWLREGEILDYYSKGARVANADEIPHSVRAGFHIPSLYSTVITWGEYAETLIKAYRGTTKDKQWFINSWKCEPFEEEVRKVDYKDILAHVDSYKLGMVPGKNILALACTVDVQEDCIWYVVRAWGYGGRSYLVRYGSLSNLGELGRILDMSYLGVDIESGQNNGIQYRVNVCWIDCGYKTTDVIEYCQTRPGVCFPIKGEGRTQYSHIGFVRSTKYPNKDLTLWLIDSGPAFDQLFLRRMKFNKFEDGYWSLPLEVKEGLCNDYIVSLSSWEKVEEETGKFRWRSKNKEEEHLGDCEKYQEALAFTYQFAFYHEEPITETKQQQRKQINQQQPIFSARPDGRGWFDR